MTRVPMLAIAASALMSLAGTSTLAAAPPIGQFPSAACESLVSLARPRTAITGAARVDAGRATAYGLARVDITRLIGLRAIGPQGSDAA